MRVLVCGSRIFNTEFHKQVLYRVLNTFHKISPISLIIEGDAPGADRFAREWAIDNGIDYKTFPAHWDEYMKAAGPIRNQQMIDEGLPDHVVAFPLGEARGTKDMINRAKKHQIKVTIVEEK